MPMSSRETLSIEHRDKDRTQDMSLLPIITQLLAAVSIVTLIWLAARAFGKSFGWGVGVLLLSPFSAVAFGMKHWKEEKYAFLAYIASTLGFIFLALYLFSAWGGWEVMRTRTQAETGLQNGNLPIHQARAFMQANQKFVENAGFEINKPSTVARVRQLLELEAARQGELEAERLAQLEARKVNDTPLNRKVKPEQERYRLVYRTINVSDAPKYIGATVKVTRRNAQEKEYRLTAASKHSLKLAQRDSGGTYSFRLRNNDIEKLRVLTKQPVPSTP